MHTTAWQGKRVLVVGLGLHGGGVGAARFFATQGAHVHITDLRDADVLRPSLEQIAGLSVTLTLGEHRLEDLDQCDFVLRNPGVPPDAPFILEAKDRGIPVLTDAALFMRETSAFVIGITGTKGKTTTTSLIAEGLTSLGAHTSPVGVPGGVSFLEALDAQPELVVAEFSSWDLEDLVIITKSPAIAVVTSFFPDHLNRHKTMTRYAEAKSHICRHQRPGDITVALETDEAIRPITDACAGTLIHVTESAVHGLPKLNIPGEHQRTNAALAVEAIVQALAHADFPFPELRAKRSHIIAAVRSISGLPGRYEVLGTVSGRTYINDTTATNPGAAIKAILATQAPIVLIAGGDGKGLAYRELAEAIRQHVRHLVLLPGTAADALQKELAAVGYTTITSGMMDMEAAVRSAKQTAQEGETILLSPGASSLNAFPNEFVRGDQFRKYALGNAAETV